MFKTIANAWKVPDLRKKMLFTILIVVIFRIGSKIPVPFLDVQALQQLTGSWNDSNNMLAFLDTFSGGAFSNATLFAMSVTPYINSSIIMQLLTVAIPALERLSKEGTEGRKKIASITRYVTVALGIIQGTAYYVYLLRSGITNYSGWNFEGIYSAITIVLVFTAGTALMMWLGEQINQNGLGNGISILLFVGIIARLLQPRYQGRQCYKYHLSDSIYNPFPYHYLGYRFHERCRAQNPRTVCKACCRPQNVWRTKLTPSY